MFKGYKLDSLARSWHAESLAKNANLDSPLNRNYGYYRPTAFANRRRCHVAAWFS